MYYKFFIPYIGKEVTVDDYHFKLIARYYAKEIGFTRYYREIRELLTAQMIPRGYLRSVAMYMVGMYERLEYEPVELEKCAIIHLVWYIKTAYTTKKGHYFITEGSAEIELQIPLDCWKMNEKEILDTLGNILESKYVEGYMKEYIFIPESDIYWVFDQAVIYDIKTVPTDIEECTIKATLIEFQTGIRRSEEAVIMWNIDLSRRIAVYIEQGLEEFVDRLHVICGR